jgi:hypothetical protein
MCTRRSGRRDGGVAGRHSRPWQSWASRGGAITAGLRAIASADQHREGIGPTADEQTAPAVLRPDLVRPGR